MTAGVLFLNISTKCLARLVVSLHSLRQHYDGPICLINAAGHDGGIAERIAADERLGVELRQTDIKIYRRRSAYVAKPSLYRFTPFERTLFVDADTVFIDDPSPMLKFESPFVVTQFSNWRCDGGIVRKRIEPFLRIGDSAIGVPRLASQVIREGWPAINTGVFKFDLDWAGMRSWERLTQAARTRANFTDEIAANVLLPFFDDDAMIVDDRYNWSPLYGQSADPVIVHSHGQKSCRPESLPYFWPVFSSAWDQNIGGICDWIRQTGERRLLDYLNSIRFFDSQS